MIRTVVRLPLAGGLSRPGHTGCVAAWDTVIPVTADSGDDGAP